MKKEKKPVWREIYKDTFGTERLQEATKLEKAEVRQIDNHHYVQPAYLLSIPVGKYDDGTTRTEQYVMQGAEHIISDIWGIVLMGFVEQCDQIISHRHDDQEGAGIFRREKWIVPFEFVR